MIDTIAWKFQTGSQWIHLPEKYGNWRGAYNRLRMWAVDGTWERVFTALVAQTDAEDDLNWAVSVDSTIVRAHQHPAGARKKGAPAGEPADHAIGCSRGGLTTRIHLASDAHCRPLAFHLTAGQAGDAPAFAHVMAGFAFPGGGEDGPAPGRTWSWPTRHSSRAVREHLRKRGIRAVIPVPADQRGHRLRRGNHPLREDATTYLTGLHIAGGFLWSAR
ncbi:IS5 family transposase [Streptomyces sp. NPDC006670]|uniref:IS5 family transposase n=1 Tax=Streptomyces sp. NPDC006670 TaxID=3154476 RepID=UPI0033CA9572